MPLTQKQSEILKAIIEEHIVCAQPIASVELVEKRELHISGATVRNVMAALVHMGYLQMLHVSSGRTPTDMAYRYYVAELEEAPSSNVSVLEEVAMKQKVWESRYEVEKFLKKVTEALSDITGLIGIALTDDTFLTYSGVGRILDLPEFFELDTTRAVLKFIDNYELVKKIFSGATRSSNEPVTLIGREIGVGEMENIGLVYNACKIGNKNCFIGVVGPTRINYPKVISVVKYMTEIVQEVTD